MAINSDRVIDAAIAGGISLTGMLIAVALEQPEGAGFEAIGDLTWLVIGATAFGNFLKDWKTRRSRRG